MKATAEYMQDLADLEPFFGFDLSQCEQGSDEWLAAKLGVISASMVSKIIKKGHGPNGYSVERDSYMKELVGEVGTKFRKQLTAAALEWGTMNELGARAEFELANNVAIDEIPFIFKDLAISGIDLPNMRCGVSLDGRVNGVSHVLEIKAPFTPKVYLDFVLDSKVKPEYMYQVAFQMWCTGAEKASFINYDPRFKSHNLHGITIERDEKTMEIFDIEIPKFIAEMNTMMDKLGIVYGDQWK